MRVIERTIEHPEDEGVILEYVKLTKDFAEIKEYVKHKGDTIMGYTQDHACLSIRIEDILYFETVDGNAFAYTADELYPKAKKIILVTDNLNIHAPSSLYKAFSAQEANRLTKRFEWHYTPKHGSWLDMAEIEIGVMSRQALAKPFPDLESFEKQVRSWTVNRNAKCVKINWQFTTADARIKLAKLYPTTL